MRIDPTSGVRRIANKSHNQFIANGVDQHRPTRAVPESFLVPLSPEQKTTVAQSQEAALAILDSILGRPTFSAPGFILYKGDCVASMEKLRQSRFQSDLTVTSPPYNIGKEYEKIVAVDDYVNWCSTWMEHIHALTSPNGAFWLNVGYLEVPQQGQCVPIPYLLWNKSSFYFLQEVVWRYGAGVSSAKRLSPRNEKWLFYVRNRDDYIFNLDDIRDPNVKYPNQKKNGKFRCNPLGKNPSDVWEFPKVTTGSNRSSKERTGHPAQFPLPIVERIIRASSNIGSIVLDPFFGSGSCGIAAAALGRVGVGFELKDEYVRIAIDRYKDLENARLAEQAQPRLF
jgi:adenine-specific DNA-methyltransferase